MDLSNTDFNGPPPIDAYGSGGFRLDKKRVEGSMILLPLVGMFPWKITTPGEMLPATFDQFVAAADSFDLILIGTGDHIALPPRKTRAFLSDIPLNFDVMDTGAACRTYNILLGENRRVAAALLAVS